MIRTFTTGSTRDTEADKFDYEGFMHPLVVQRFAQYMHKHRKQSDGELRASDNWQKGMPLEVYMKSAWRHFMAVWKEHRGIATADGIEDALCAAIFNLNGYLYELLRKQEPCQKANIARNKEK